VGRTWETPNAYWIIYIYGRKQNKKKKGQRLNEKEKKRKKNQEEKTQHAPRNGKKIPETEEKMTIMQSFNTHSREHEKEVPHTLRGKRKNKLHRNNTHVNILTPSFLSQGTGWVRREGGLEDPERITEGAAEGRSIQGL